MTTVCVVTPNLVRGGVERVVLRLIDGLDRSRFEPNLVLFSDNGGGFPRPTGVPVEVLDTTSLRGHPRVLAREWRRRPPDVVLAHTSGASVVSLVARRLARGRFPVVAVLHRPLGLEFDRKDTVMRIGSRLLLPSAAAVAAPSRGTAADIAAFLHWPSDRVRVLLNPIVDASIALDAAEPVEHPFFEPGLRVVTSAGWLTPLKDFATLVRAFARLVPHDASLRLLILGEGRERSALERLVEDLGIDERVSLPGLVANPFAYIGRSAIFALSSTSESLSNVLVEALALGTPVVSTDCVAGPREVLRGGEFGRLVPVGDDAALASAIQSTLADPPDAESLRRRANDFGAPAVAAYEELIDECVAAASIR